jgi:hypothetical protein
MMSVLVEMLVTWIKLPERPQGGASSSTAFAHQPSLLQFKENSGRPHPGLVPNGYGIATFPHCDKQPLLVPWRLLVSAAGKELTTKNTTNTLDAYPSALVCPKLMYLRPLPNATISTPGLQVIADVINICHKSKTVANPIKE